MRAHVIWGYTLIELLTTLAIISLLAMATPSLLKFVSANRQQSQVSELQRLIQSARSRAIDSGIVTTLCGSIDHINCTADWAPSSTVLLFQDLDNNHRLDDNDILIYQIQLPYTRWYWRGSNRAYLRYRSDGTPMEWGHFTACPSDSLDTTISQITINFVGRTYIKKISRSELLASENCS